MTYLEKAINDGLAQISKKGNKEFITYFPSEHREVYSDPEEKVRSEFWAELIYRYQYLPERIGIEVTVPDRTPSDRADLVIFEDDENKIPYGVVECKPEEITDSVFHQAVEQACGNGTWSKLRANYVMVVAGRTRRVLDFSDKYGVLEREANIIADLPIRYGKPKEFKFYKGSQLDIREVSKEELISAIRKCHQTLWGGGKLSPPTAFSELCKIIFVKISDEKKKRKKDEPYKFQIKTHETAKSLASRIQSLYLEEQKKDPDVFTEKINISDATLLIIVSHLESINLSATDLDVKGVAFEQFMDGFFKGDFGQYFTPREIIDFCVSALGVSDDDLVLDPACGSGGFLLHALNAVRVEAAEYYDADSVKFFNHWHTFAQNKLFGIEINEEIVRVAKMNMILHDDGHSNIIGFDALEKSEKISSENRGFADEKFSLILTNPPFGATLKQIERPYINDYQLSRKGSDSDPSELDSQRIEILFLERISRFLKPGTGRAAVIIPNSIITNESHQYVRDWLIFNFQILSVVSLPVGAFTHSGTSVKTSILLLRKRNIGEEPNQSERIFMSIPRKIGYDTTGRKTSNNLPSLSAAFRKFNKEISTYKPKTEYSITKTEDLGGIDTYVLETLGVKQFKRPINESIVVTLNQIDGPLNPERYHALWMEKIFNGHKLLDFADLVHEKINPSKNYSTATFDLIRIDDLANNPLKVERTRNSLGIELNGSFFKVKENDILFARLGPTILNRKVVLCPNSESQLLASPEFHVIRAKKGIDPYAIIAILRTKIFRDLVYSKGRGSTPSRYRVSYKDFMNLPFPNLKQFQGQLGKELKKRLAKVENYVKKVRILWD